MPNLAIIVHENPIMRSGFNFQISQIGGFHSAECNNAESALSDCKKLKPSLAIISFSIPSMGAIQLTERLKAHSPHIKVIVSASEKSGFIAEKSILNGASGYITSEISVPDFVTAVKTVHHDSTYIEPCVSNNLALKKINGREHLLDSLSPREFDVFAKVIQDKTAKKVAEELFLAEKTVANYISAVKKKLRTKTSAGLLRIGLEEGIATPP
ncbi:MAG: LuxR C-terminal-related transcriptional regulator [Pseudohongiellaceae bacterium]